MKTILSIVLLSILTLTIPLHTTFANDINDADQWVEIPWYRGPWSNPAQGGPLALSPYITTDDGPHTTGGTSVFVSKESFSLKNSFQLDVKYFFSESFNSLPLGLSIGVIKHLEIPEYEDYGSTPSIITGRYGLGGDYAPTRSENGSIKMVYDAQKNSLTTTISSFDENGKLLTNKVDSGYQTVPGYPNNFRETIDENKVRLVTTISDGIGGFNFGGPIPDGSGYFYDVKVTAAPEPITTTLFLVGGGIMGLSKLRRKKS